MTPPTIIETIARAIASVVPAGCTDSEAEAVITVLESQGYAIVLMEPSEEMLDAGHDLLTEHGCNPLSGDARYCWAAMINTGRAKA